MSNTDTTVIKQLTNNTRELLEGNYKQAEQIQGTADAIKITINHTVEFDGGRTLVRSAITYGKRVKDTVEHEVDDNQPEMSLGEGAGVKKRK